MSTGDGVEACDTYEVTEHSGDKSLLLQSRARSFTPINHGLTTFNSVVQSQKPRSRGLDRNSIYNIPEDPLPQPPSTKKRRIELATSTRPLILSGSAPSQLWNQDGHSHPQDSLALDHIINSKATQLSTPPDSKRSNKKIFGVQTIMKQRLPDYAVRKPYLHLTKWTTTEDFVNTSTHNGLARTTLEKLAAFRYQPSSPKLGELVAGQKEDPLSVQQPESNLDEECGLASQRMAPEINSPTSYQPFDWPFIEGDNSHQSGTLRQRVATGPDFLQSESSELVPESSSRVSLSSAHNQEPEVDSGTSTALPSVAVLEASAEFSSVGVAEVSYGDCWQKPIQWESPYPHHHSKEDPSSWQYDTSPDELDAMMESAINLTCEQQQERVLQSYHLVEDKPSAEDSEVMIESAIVPAHEQKQEKFLAQIHQTDDSMEDEFLFNEKDEDELAKLSVLCSSPEVYPQCSTCPSPTPSFDEREGKMSESPLKSSHSGTALPPLHHRPVAEFCGASSTYQYTKLVNEGCAHVFEAALQLSDSQHHHQHPLNSNEAPHEAVLSTSEQEMVDLGEEGEYAPMKPFARPDFPSRVHGRSLISGLSANLVLRTCFRIGEAIRVSTTCDKSGQDTIIELFARVKNSSRIPGSTKQHFEFADLFNDRPPFPRGVLENYKIFALQETESNKLLGGEASGKMVRCIGRLKRDFRENGWMLYISNIRSTDWEEVRWTKMIAGAGMVKSGRTVWYQNSDFAMAHGVEERIAPHYL